MQGRHQRRPRFGWGLGMAAVADMRKAQRLDRGVGAHMHDAQRQMCWARSHARPARQRKKNLKRRRVGRAAGPRPKQTADGAPAGTNAARRWPPSGATTA